VNSFLAVTPAVQRERYRALATFPDPTAMDCLYDIGVTHILVDYREAGALDLMSDADTLTGLGLETIYRDTTHQVLAVSGSEAGD
jgi:hypothetical protein